jgi:rare lipoprotein A
MASFYGEDNRGDRTASGKPYNPDDYVAAHPHFPIGTIVRVTNLENGRTVNVRIVDRGPSVENRYEGVIIDLSKRAAERLGFRAQGRTRVRTEVIKWGSKQEN